jgi:hypothetical protein
MDELDDIIMNVEVQLLICYLANGCTVTRSGSAPFWRVMPIPGHPIPRINNGQVNDSAVNELSVRNMADIFGSMPPQTCKLNALGEAYYERHLKAY